MPHTVELPDGTVEFPDEMSEEDINQAIQSHLGPTDYSNIKPSAYEAAEIAQPGIGREAMGPGTGFTTALAEGVTQDAPELVKAGLSKLQGPLEKVGAPIAKLLHGATIPFRLMLGQKGYAFAAGPKEGEPVIPEIMPGEDEKGVIPSVRRFAGGMTTGGSMLALGLAPESKLVQGLFGAGAAANIPESLRDIATAKTAEETRGAYTDFLLNTGGAYLMGRGALKKRIPNASSIEKAAEVHGDVRAQPGEGQRQVPTEESRGGVQPPAETKKAEVLLDPATREKVLVTANDLARLPKEQLEESGYRPTYDESGKLVSLKDPEGNPVELPRDTLTAEEQAYIDAEREGVGVDVEIAKPGVQDPNEPFAKPSAGWIASIDRENKKVIINPREFSGWLADLPENKRKQAVRSLLDEERIHLSVDNDSANAYWNSLTAAEKAISKRRYSGNWQGNARVGEAPFSDLVMGHEALRFRLQQLARMTPRELADTVGRENWTLKTITALESAIRTVRETLGTKASKEQQAIAERMLGNLAAAKVAMSGVSPAAIRKGKEEESRRFGVVTDEGGRHHIPVTIQRADGSTYQAQFNGYYDLREMGGGAPESIGYQLPSGDWTHGGIHEGEKLLTKLPDVDQWKELFEPRKSAFAAAAFRRGKSKPEPQAELYLPPLPRGEKVERPPAGELGAIPVTASGIQKAAYEHFQSEMDNVLEAYEKNPASKPKAPSFESFSAALRGKFGGNISETALRDAFKDAVWQPLMNASGKKLEAMRQALNLKTAVGSRRVSDPAGNVGPELLQTEGATPEARKQIVEDQRTRSRAQSYRSTVISAIGRKLTGSDKGNVPRGNLKRSEVIPEDIGHGEESKQPAYHEITGPDAANARVLAGELTDDARKMGTAVSNTKRVTVLQNKQTGKVEMVSTYRDPRRGAVILDPDSPSQTHGRLDSVLKRYRPIASILLKDPVKDFRQSFESLGDYENRFGQHAKSGAANAFVDPGMSPTDLQASPSGGRMATPGQFLDRPGVLEAGERVPLTTAEAGSILDHVLSESGSFHGPDDVKASWAAMKEDTNLQALSGYRKLFAELEGKYPDASAEELMDRLAQEIYENHKAATSYDDFVSRTMAQGGPQAREALQAESKTPPVQEPAGKELTMRKRVPPTVVRPEQVPPGSIPEPKPAPPVPEATLERAKSPAAFRRVKEAAKEQLELTGQLLGATIKRGVTKEDAARILDGADNAGRQYSMEAGEAIRYASKEAIGSKKERKGMLKEAEQRRTAAIAFVSSGFLKDTPAGKVWTPRKAELATFETFLASARGKAAIMAGDTNPFRRRAGKAWQKAIDDYQKDIDYARAHWRDPAFRATAEQYRTEIKEAIDMENAHGGHITERENYTPGVYEGEFWADNVITFAGRRLLGQQYRMKKSFRNPYEAINAGPYILASRDVATLAEHRILQGQRIIARKSWLNALQHLRDPDSREPVAKEPIYATRDVTDPVTGLVRKEGYWQSPSPEYELVPTSNAVNSKPIAVRTSFAGLVGSVIAPSRLSEMRTGVWPLLHDGLIATSILKHGVILLWDSFHPGRLAQYGMSLLGIREAGYKGGHSALTIREGDLAKAVSTGDISQAAADWALKPIDVHTTSRTRTATGWTTTPGTVRMTRQQIAKEFVRQGLNASKISDALYKDAVQHIPFIGEKYHKMIAPYNRWMFDRFIPGLIVESAVRQFEKRNRPGGLHPAELIKNVLTDMNIFYGNMGRQGVFKNATVRDMAQLMFLAPMWQEGLLQKEIRYASRATGMSWLAGRRGLGAREYFGALGEGMTKGLLAYFVGTQVINLITRGKFTFQNEEEGHKMDAALQIGDKTIWISPLSVFAEVTHDLIRLAETKPKIWDAILQMGENRMGPFGKMEQILRTGIAPTGEKYSTTGGVIKGALGQLAPAPISIAPLVRAGANKLFPNQVSPVPPGQLARQMIGSFAGIKAQVGRSVTQQVFDKAAKFVEKEGLKKSTGWDFQMTDEPSYTRLRTALKNADIPTAKKTLASLREKKSDEAIYKAMKLWAKRPFTGNKKAEELFKQSLSDDELEVYTRANEERMELLGKFEDFLAGHEQSPE